MRQKPFFLCLKFFLVIVTKKTMCYNSFMEKSYKKIVDYVKNEIQAGKLKPGDKLMAERELAEHLGMSRNSVREGLRLLENIGVLNSHQGSGNYIDLNFNETMTDVLSFMYLLKGIGLDQVTEYRLLIERDAMRLAVLRATDQQKKDIMEQLAGLEEAGSEEERVIFDKAIHKTLVEASHNDFLITNYEALANLMDRYIQSMRLNIIIGMQSQNMLEHTHRMLAEAVAEGDYDKGIKGLETHFGYIEQFKNG